MVKKIIGITIGMAILISLSVVGYASHSKFSSVLVEAEDANNDSDSPVLEIRDLDDNVLLKLDEDGNIYTGSDIIVPEKWLAPAATSTTGCTASSLFDTTVVYSNTITITNLSTQPAYARNVTWGCSNAAGIISANPGNTVYITVYGLDAMCNAVTEIIQANSTTVTTSPNSGVGNVAFSYVNTITFSTGFITDLGHIASTSPYYYIGWGDKLGLSHDIYGDTVIKVIESATDIRPTSAGTINETYNTYDPYNACNATLNVEIWYKTRRLTINP